MEGATTLAPIHGEVVPMAPLALTPATLLTLGPGATLLHVVGSDQEGGQVVSLGGEYQSKEVGPLGEEQVQGVRKGPGRPRREVVHRLEKPVGRGPYPCDRWGALLVKFSKFCIKMPPHSCFQPKGNQHEMYHKKATNMVP